MSNFNKLSDSELQHQLDSLQASLKGQPEALVIQRLFEELQAHEMGLELQNSELLEARAKLEQSRDRYADLYDFAPVGYLTLEQRTGKILEINLAGAAMLGAPRLRVVGMPISTFLPTGETLRLFEHLKSVSQRGEKTAMELRIRARRGPPRHFRLESVAADSREGAATCRTVMIDITERKKAQEALRKAHDELEATVRQRTAELAEINNSLRKSQQLLQAVLDNASVVIYVKDAEGRYILVNRRWEEVFGRRMPDVVGKTDHDFLAHEVADAITEHDQVVLQAKAAMTFGETIQQGDGDHAYMSVKFPLCGTGGEPYGLCGISTDITDRERDLKQLKLAAQVFNSAAESIMILDAKRRVVEVNAAFTTTTGYSPQEIVGQRHWPQKASAAEQKSVRAIWKALKAHDRWRGEIMGQRKNGELFPQLLNINVVRDDRGEVSNYVAILSDITDLKSSQERLEYVATHDRLTGLANRSLLYDRLQHGLDTASRRNKRLAVLFVDLDNFKTINDTLGHEMGDLLLVQVAERLRACTRKQDTIGRLGGDEFTVLTEDLDGSTDVASTTAQRIVDALLVPFDLMGREAIVSASVGIALYPKDGRNVSSLLKRADAAMYRAKELGKNNFQFFSEEMNIHVMERQALENGLRAALKRGEFFLLYQPLMALDSSQINGVEALLRWRHPQRGVLLPEEFIPHAEESGLILPIGEWVLQTACAQLRQWLQDGAANLRVAINLSARQFRQKDLPGMVRRIMRKNRVSPANLEIELTESTLMENAEAAAGILRQLKDMGIRLAIDDFGTGYSSLRYLQQFPIDRLKIDGHFTRDLATNPNDQAIATAIITMGHSMQLSVVAEGVETDQQFEFLKNRGCDFVQGYYVQQPLPPEQAAVALGLAGHA